MKNTPPQKSTPSGTTPNPNNNSSGGSKLVIPKFISKKGGLDDSGAKDKWVEISRAITQIYAENASQLSFQTLYT